MRIQFTVAAVTLVALAGGLAVSQGVVGGDSAVLGTDQASKQTSLSAETVASLRSISGDVIGPFDPASPSIIHVASGESEDHRADSTVSLEFAEGEIAKKVGLDPAAIMSSELVTLTSNSTFNDGEGGASVAGVLLYEGTAVWAVEYKAVKIRRSGPVGGPDHGETYDATMVAFVDAYTGDFLLADQV